MTTRGGLHRLRPGPEAIAPAADTPAVSIGAGMWMSPGISNAYALQTREGRVVVNTGANFEGVVRRRAFDAVSPGPTRAIIVTQGHADHFGAVPAFRESETDVVVQANHRIWRSDHELLPTFHTRNTAFAFSHMFEALADAFASLPPELQQQTYPEPTIVVGERLDLTFGDLDVVLLSAPGGETTDGMLVWLPAERTLFTGNFFGPLFGHVPNLITIRGDRYRDPLRYVEGCDLVLELGPERLLTGHFDPIEGADVIRSEVMALRDSTQWVHDRVVEGMEAGADVHTLMRDIRLPDDFDIGEAYGRVVWNVRAIWEMYAGWFHHRSTTELYPVPPLALADDVVAAAGADALVAAAAAREAAGEAAEAIQLTDLVLAVDPGHPGARRVAIAAHEQLMAPATNFWELAWLRHQVTELQAGS